jgi:acyl-CoA synthetase (AMP-forming)/AMP-acid ligase II
MSGARELLREAHRRADVLRPGYRAAGHWSSEPHDGIRVAATRWPARIALVARETSLTFRELDGRIDAAARTLLARGVAADEPVVVVVGNDVDSVVAVHAGLRCDAVVMLVPRSTGGPQTADIIRRTGARFGVAPGWAPATQPELAQCCAWVDPGEPTDGLPESPSRPADEPGIVLFTSGTTSKPKGVIHSASTLGKAASNYVAAAGLGADDGIFLISPLASVTGVLQALFIGPMLGIPVVLEDRWDAACTCDLLLSSGATWYGGPDRLLDRLLDEVRARGAENPLRAVYLGGTMLDRRIVERVEDDFGIVVMRAYGSSEVPVSTSGQRAESRDARHADDGMPLHDVEVRAGSTGDPNECCIRGPHAFLGYTDAADDAAAFDGEWFRTGDVADVTGGRVRIVGRIKDIVIRNGMKIAVAEVEEIIARIQGVSDCAAYSVPDATTGEHLAVAVVLEQEADVRLTDVTKALLSAGLPKYKLPEELVFWDQPLPVNATGKVTRKTLHEASDGRPRIVADRLASAP